MVTDERQSSSGLSPYQNAMEKHHFQQLGRPPSSFPKLIYLTVLGGFEVSILYVSNSVR